MLYRLSYLATMKTQRYGERPALRLRSLLAEPTGFEPATFCVTGRYANRYTTAPSFRLGIARGATGSADNDTHSPEGLSTAAKPPRLPFRHPGERLDLDQHPRPVETWHREHGDGRRMLAPRLQG